MRSLRFEAIKKFINESGEMCFEAGKDMARWLVVPASLSFASGSVKAALSQA